MSPRPRPSGRAIHILVAAGAALSFTVDTVPAAIQTFAGIQPGVATLSSDSGMDADLASIPLTLGMRVRRLSLRAIVPYVDLSARTPEVAVPLPLPGSPALTIPPQSVDEAGIGDVIFTPALLLSGGGVGRSSLWGSVRVKLPTADESRWLGTGETDYAPGLGALVPLGTRFVALGLVRYNVRGDAPQVEYRDYLQASLGGTVRLGLLDALTTTVTRGDATSGTGDPADSLALSWYHPLGRGGTAFTASALAGATGDDRTYGLSLGITLNDGPYDWGR